MYVNRLIALVTVVGCGGAPQKPVAPAPPSSPPGVAQTPVDRTPEAPRRLLSIDWAHVHLASDADALALWTQIAPTGDDWSQKLDEVPRDDLRPLAIALVRGGNFQCVPVVPQRDCATPVFDVPDPVATAGFTDPCLRRRLALWAFDQLEPEDFPSVRDAVQAIAKLPAPETELIKTALRAVPDDDQATRYAMLASAWAAGQHELVNTSLSQLDEAHAIDAAIKLHVDGALDVLTADTHRSVYLAAATDEAMAAKARAGAITELLAGAPDKLPADLAAALVKATASKDCSVAAVAANALAQHGDKKYLPRRPSGGGTPAMMRGLCVLASYATLEGADPTLFAAYVPAKGLEKITVAYDALSEVDTDGDGDPHTERSAELVPHTPAMAIPDADDVARALHASCKGTTCTSADHEVRFTFRGAELARLEIVERPPCTRP